MKKLIALVLSLTLLIANADTQQILGAIDNYPSLSPDGKTIIFTSTRSGRRAIWAADADGKMVRMIFDGGADTDPVTPDWSPDGRKIVFAMTPSDATNPDESEIYVMSANGSDIRRLTRVPGDDSHPHWSADGKRIFFNSARQTPDLKKPWSAQWIDIFSMAADGSDIRRHTDCRSVCTYPSLSPDGKYVVYRKVIDGLGLSWDLSPGNRNSEIFVGLVDGSSSINISNNPAYDGWPTWTPDGRWVIYASNREKLANTGQIYAVRPDGSEIRRLTHGQWSRAQPRVDATGKKVYVAEGIEQGDFETYHIASFTFLPSVE